MQLLKKCMAYILCFAMLLSVMSGALVSFAEETVADENTEAASDLFANANAADAVGILGGGNFSYDANSTVVYGTESTKSWMFAGNESAAGWPTALLGLGGGIDMTGKFLEFDIKTEGGRGYVAISSLHDATTWGNLCAKDTFNVSATFNTSDWATVAFDLDAIVAEGKDLTNVGFIKLGFDFDTNAGTERKYYIDNVRLVDHVESTVAEDWIHMSMDSGMSAGASYSIVPSPVKAPNSNRSMKVVTSGSGEVALTFNPQSAVINGQLAALPNMNEGYLSAYFYFGDQTPSAKLRLTSSTWAGGISHSFTMVDVGDGWYYGYVDVSALTFYADQIAAGANKDAIIRISIYLPANNTIYIDGLTFPAEVPEEYLPTEPPTTEAPTEPETEPPVVYPVEDFFSTATIACGELQTEVTNGSDYAWKLIPSVDASHRWGYPSIILDDTYDISNHELIMDVMPVDMDSFMINLSTINDTWITATSTGLTVGQWNTVTFDLTTNGKDIVEMSKLGLGVKIVDSDDDYAVYIDNVKLVEIEEEIPTEPPTEAPTEPPTEPPTTEPAPVDENDMLGVCNNIAYNKTHWENVPNDNEEADVYTGFTVMPDTEHITGEGSIRSWKFAAAADANAGNVVAQFHLGQSYDMTGKNLAFDVYYDADTRLQQQISFRLHNSGWSNINDTNRTIKINPGQWKTVVIDFSSVVNEGKDLSAVTLLSMYFDFAANTGVERAVYIDNVRIVTDEETQLIEEPLPEPQDENDMLGKTENISYNKTHWENVENGNDTDGNPIEDVVSGLTCGRDTENITGEGSIRSWYFAADASVNFSNAIAQLRFAQGHDLTGKSLSFDVKFESEDPNAIQKFSVKLHGSNWGDLVVERGVRVHQDGWQHVIMNFSESMLEGKNLSDVCFITFAFDFAANTGYARRVNIDNVSCVDTEDINQDLTGAGVDTGMSSAPVFFRTDEKTYGDSAQSYKIITGTDSNVFVLNTQYSVEQGNLDNYPDMENCLFTGYFWFGDAEPAAAMSITEGSWATSIYSDLTFEAVGDGWYRGTLSSKDIMFDDDATEKGANGDQILRIALQLPENAVVYIDEFTVTETDPEPVDPHDLLGDLKYFVYDKDNWAEGSGLGYGRNETYLYGRDSVRSWSFTAAANADVATAIAQFRLRKVHDMSDATLLLDVYYASESDAAQTIGVRMHNSNWGNINDVNKTFDVTPNEWTTIVVDFSSVILDGADLTDLRFISFYFDFSSNTGADRAVYIDNVRLYRAETVREDWTNMTQDSGSYYKNTDTNITNDVDAIYAEGSYQGLYVKAPADSEGKVTFNTQQAVNLGEIDALPDMTSGTLGAWFYFGDTEPSAYVKLTDASWRGSRGVDFTFGENHNGWYYGTIDCSTITYSETATPGDVIRVTINVPAGFEGYIDGLTYTPVELPVELKFAAATLKLHYDLNILMKVNKSLFGDGLFSDPYITYELNGTTYTVTEYTEEGARYVFALEHIAPTHINDTIPITLHATYQGSIFKSKTLDYSISHYCYAMMEQYTGKAYGELRTLLVDILNYGTEAQKYFNYNTEQLANANLTPEQAAWGTPGDPAMTSVQDSQYATVENPTASFKGVGLKLQNNISIYFRFQAESMENVKVVITTAAGYSFTYTDFIPAEDGTSYYVVFKHLNATMIRVPVYATVYCGDTPISNTLRYSIESYAFSQADSDCGELVKAVLRYGHSAAAFVKAYR